MERLKWIVAWILFLTGALTLVLVPYVVRAFLDGLAPLPPDAAIPAFTVSALQTLGHVEAICFGMLSAAIVAAVLAIRRARSREAARFWIAVLAGVELHIGAFMLMLALLGGVVLPRLANTPQPATITAVAQVAGAGA